MINYTSPIAKSFADHIWTVLSCVLLSVLPFQNIHATNADSLQLNAIIDSIDTYLYVVNKAETYINEAGQFISKKSSSLNNNQILRFIEIKYYYLLHAEKNLEVFKEFAKTDSILHLPNVDSNFISKFKYLEAYNLMILNDYESSQQKFEELLQSGKKKNILAIQIRANFSLGQLSALQKNYVLAEKFFKKSYHLSIQDSVMRNGVYNDFSELTNLSIKVKKYDQALEYAKKGLEVAIREKNHYFEANFYVNFTKIYTHYKQISKAEKYLKKAFEIHQRLGETEKSKRDIVLLKAEILSTKGDKISAIKLYESTLIEVDQIDFVHLESHLPVYEKLHSLYKEIDDYKAAYETLENLTLLNDKLSKYKKDQQLNFLEAKLKLDENKIEKELLNAKITKQEYRSQLMYLGMAGLFSILIFLVYSLKVRKDFNQRLRKKVEDRTMEIIKTNEKLRQSNTELENFNFILSHDLKEPVRNIVSFSALSRRIVKPDTKLGEYFTFIESNGKHLSQLIQDVLSYQKITNMGKNEIIFGKINTNQLIEEITETLSKTVELKKKAGFSYEDLPKVICNQNILLIVFKNLIENGIMYNKNTFPLVKISYRREEDLHVFNFEDNGIGIEKEFYEKVFMMFKKLNHKSKFKGSGLGLSISRKLLSKINGRITIIHSRINEGTIFQVSFPATLEVSTLHAEVKDNEINFN